MTRTGRTRLVVWTAAAVAVAVVVGAFVLWAPRADPPRSDRELIEEQVRGHFADLSRGAFLASQARRCDATPAAISAAADDSTPGPILPVDLDVDIERITITGDSAEVDASFGVPGHRTPMPLRFERRPDRWCIV